MARKYSRGASREVKNEMHRYKRGKARSGPGGRGGKVKSRKQAIAIALSKARKKERRRRKRERKNHFVTSRSEPLPFYPSPLQGAAFRRKCASTLGTRGANLS